MTLEDDWGLTRKGWLHHFMGGWDNAIQFPRFCKLYFGLNVEYSEGASIDCIRIPIPFMKRDHGIIRYKKINFPETYGGYKIRCDQEIERMERIQYEGILQPLIEAQLQMLRYIAKGPYDSSR